MIEQNYNLDTVPFQSAVPVVHVSQYDSGSRTLKFKLLQAGSNYDMTGVTGAQINGKKPDGTEFSYNMTISNDVVSVVITEQMAAVAGRVMAEVVLTGANSSVLGTANFIIEVEKSPLDEGVISDTEIPIIMDFVTGGTPGQVFKRTATGGEWADESGGGTVWGGITGDMADQTDLNNALTALNDNLSTKVSSVNTVTPDANGNVQIDATHIDTSSSVAIKSASGNPVTIADALQGKALGVNTTLEPIQDLHGYDHPWAGGAGKNKLNPVNAESVTASGVTFTVNEDGTITANGTAVTNAACYIFGNASTYVDIGVPVGNYVLNGGISEGCKIFAVRNRNGTTATFNTDLTDTAIDIEEGDTFRIFARVNRDVTVNNDKFKPMLRLATEPDSTFEPYSNICPISGISTLEIANNGTTGVTVALGQTVYGGTLNISTGELVSTYANIASYNGETIREPWLSSMDEYVAGATPTTGAQVVYPLATPTESLVTPAQLNLLTGTNILTTNADDLTVRYYATGQTGNVEGNLSFLLDETANNETAIITVSESIAPIETGTATQVYAVGDYLMLNNRLCKVTVAIATGESIIVGTNARYTTVADELKAILAQISA